MSALNIIINHSNIPQLIENQNKEFNKNSNCNGNPNNLDCIVDRLRTIDEDKENCIKVMAEPHSYFLETVEKCKNL